MNKYSVTKKESSYHSLNHLCEIVFRSVSCEFVVGHVLQSCYESVNDPIEGILHKFIIGLHKMAGINKEVGDFHDKLQEVKLFCFIDSSDTLIDSELWIRVEFG